MLQKIIIVYFGIFAAFSLCFAAEVKKPLSEFEKISEPIIVKDIIESEKPIALLIGIYWCDACAQAFEYWQYHHIGPFKAYYLFGSEETLTAQPDWLTEVENVISHFRDAGGYLSSFPLLIFYNKKKEVKSFIATDYRTINDWLIENFPQFFKKIN